MKLSENNIESIVTGHNSYCVVIHTVFQGKGGIGHGFMMNQVKVKVGTPTEEIFKDMLAKFESENPDAKNVVMTGSNIYPATL